MSEKILTTNREANHHFHIEHTESGGMMLEGWEAKAIRLNPGSVSLKGAYLHFHAGELFLRGVHISPPQTVVAHSHPDPVRERKVLMTKHQLNRYLGSVTRDGYTLVPINFHLKHGKIKVEVGLAKGKNQRDKRADVKERDIARSVRKNLDY